MILTTTHAIEGHRIIAYRGIVVGEAMLMVSVSGTAVVNEG